MTGQCGGHALPCRLLPPHMDESRTPPKKTPESEQLGHGLEGLSCLTGGMKNVSHSHTEPLERNHS